MILTKQWLSAAAGLLIAGSALAAPVDVGGVKMEDSADVRGAKLVLNGAGVRYKAVFKIYAAGLYLGQKQTTAEDVLAAPGAKRIQVTMLRDIDANELGKLFTRGVQDNAPKDQMSKLIPGLMRMSQVFSDQKKLVAGDMFMMDWVPGTGSVLTVKGVPQGEPFKEPEFYNAMLRIWLGPQPADWKLKDALLGKGA
jgi:hypothetical protein